MEDCSLFVPCTCVREQRNTLASKLARALLLLLRGNETCMPTPGEDAPGEDVDVCTFLIKHGDEV